MKSVACLFVLTGLAFAEEAPGNLPARALAANDLISITVFGSPELTRSVRLGPDGKIRLPMLSRKIDAAGLEPVQLEEQIARALTTEQVLIDPSVTVAIAEYASRPVSVAGAVRHPLTFQITQKTTLLEALT